MDDDGFEFFRGALIAFQAEALVVAIVFAAICFNAGEIAQHLRALLSW